MNRDAVYHWTGAGALTVFVGLLAVTGQSFWIDEANSALIAMPGAWGDFLNGFLSSRQSDLQMPGYMVYLWFWENCFGHGERALRLANLPWLVVALAAVVGTLKEYRRFAWMFVVGVLIHPLTWQYLDEARPYTMQFSGSVLLLLGIAMWLIPGKEEEERPLWGSVFMVGGSIVLSSSSLLGAVFAAFFVLGWLILGLMGYWVPGRRIRCSEWLVFGLGSLALGGLAAFYLWTLLRGAGASQLGSGGILALGFSAYELLGFGGLGPGRLDLRENGVGALWAYVIPICGLAFAYGWLLWAGSKEVLEGKLHILRSSVKNPLIWIVGLSIAAPLLVLIAGSEVFQFRLLGRHFMPMLPVVLLGLTWLVYRISQAEKASGGPVLLLVLVLFFSCFSWRTSMRHKKDDYRAAARVAREAVEEGKLVTWAASHAGAKYYGLGQLNIAFLRAGVPYEELLHQGKTDVVILSKPDLYDSEGKLREWVQKNSFRESRSLHSFSIFQ